MFISGDTKITLKTVETGLLQVIDGEGAHVGYEWFDHVKEINLSDYVTTVKIDPANFDD